MRTIVTLLCVVGVAFAQPLASDSDSVLMVHRLSPAAVAQFSAVDQQISPFWSHWEGRDSVLMVPSTHSHSAKDEWSGEGDAAVVLKAAGAPSGLYLLVTVHDDSWVCRDTTSDPMIDLVTFWLDTMELADMRACLDCLFGLAGASVTYSGPGYGLEAGREPPAQKYMVMHKDPSLWSYQMATFSFQDPVGDYYASMAGLTGETVFEAAGQRSTEWRLPWSAISSPSWGNLTSPPPAGRRLSLSLEYLDTDSPDTVSDSWLTWIGDGLWDAENVAGYGWGELVVAENMDDVSVAPVSAPHFRAAAEPARALLYDLQGRTIRPEVGYRGAYITHRTGVRAGGATTMDASCRR